jgi:hypothetical protein
MIHNWMKMLLAILVGNVIYFAAVPSLPKSLVHNLYRIDFGLVVDLAICAGIYLLFRSKTNRDDSNHPD